MVQSPTSVETEVTEAPDLEQALEAALSLWAIIEVVETLPTTTETRERLQKARLAFDAHLGALGWDEALLRSLADGCPEYGLSPPDAPAV